MIVERLSPLVLVVLLAAPVHGQAPATQKPASPKPAAPKAAVPPPASQKPPSQRPPASQAPPSTTPPAPAVPPPAAGAAAAPGAAGATASGEKGVAVPAEALTAAIDKLGALDFPVRMQASRVVRRAPAGQSLPALVAAASAHKDGYVRFRALVLLAGFPDPQVATVMTSVLDDPNDRLRDVAYAWLERNPNPALAPRLIGKLDKETSEFVRPSLIHALAALGTDVKVQQIMLREVNRGQDFFRSIVIDALGKHRAAYATPALTAIAKQDGPLQDDAVVALGQIGDKRSLDTIAAQQRSAPRERQPALASAICLLGVNCESHERFLVDTLKFTIKNPGFQDLVRSTSRGLSALAVAGHDSDWDVLIFHGQSSVDPVRAPVALAFASAAVARPESLLSAIERAPDQKGALNLLRDGFDMLEEDFSEEQFYVAIRRMYWKAPDGSPTRRAAEALITTLEF
jgi:HEAT repeat protein